MISTQKNGWVASRDPHHVPMNSPSILIGKIHFFAGEITIFASWTTSFAGEITIFAGESTSFAGEIITFSPVNSRLFAHQKHPPGATSAQRRHRAGALPAAAAAALRGGDLSARLGGDGAGSCQFLCQKARKTIGKWWFNWFNHYKWWFYGGLIVI